MSGHQAWLEAPYREQADEELLVERATEWAEDLGGWWCPATSGTRTPCDLCIETMVDAYLSAHEPEG